MFMSDRTVYTHAAIGNLFSVGSDGRQIVPRGVRMGGNLFPVGFGWGAICSPWGSDGGRSVPRGLRMWANVLPVHMRLYVWKRACIVWMRACIVCMHVHVRMYIHMPQ